MSKRRSRLLVVSVACTAVLPVGAALLQWEGAPWNRLHAVPLRRLKTTGAVESLGWSPEAISAVTLLSTLRLERWDGDGHPLPVMPLKGYGLSPSGDLGFGLLSQPKTRRASYLEVRHLASGHAVHRLALPPEVVKLGLEPGALNQFSGDDEYAASFAIQPRRRTSTRTELLSVWNTHTGRLVWKRVLERQPLNNALYHKAVFFDGGQMLWLGESPGGTSRQRRGWGLHDARTDRLEIPLPRTDENQISKWGWWRPVRSPRGKYLLSGYSRTDGSGVDIGQRLCIWRLDTPSVAWQWDAGAYYPLQQAFSPDERFLAVLCQHRQWISGQGDHTVLIFDAASGQLRASLNEDTLSRRSRRATAALGDTLSLPRRLRPVSSRQVRLEEEVPLKLAWSPDSRRLAVAYYPALIKIWAAPAVW